MKKSNEELIKELVEMIRNARLFFNGVELKKE